MIITLSRYRSGILKLRDTSILSLAVFMVIIGDLIRAFNRWKHLWKDKNLKHELQQALGVVRCDGFWYVGKHDHHNFKIQSVQAHGRTRGEAILTIILWSKHQYRTNIWIIAIAMIKFSDWESIFHPWHPPSPPSSCHQTCFCNPIPENAKDLPRHIPDCRLHLLCWSPCYPHLHPFRTQGTISLIIILHHFLPSSSSALPLRRWISKVLNKSLFQKRETVIKELAVLPESEHLKRPKLETVGWVNGIHFRKRPNKD